VKDWAIIANNLKESGWSLGWVSALDLEGRTIWIVDAHRDGRCFIVHANEKLSAFVELERQVLTVTFFLQPFIRFALGTNPHDEQVRDF